MVMKCPNCGAENPDCSYHCGSCASELRGGNKTEAGKCDSQSVKPRTDIESMLHRNLVRLGENVARRRHGLLFRLGGGTVWRSNTIVFKSEFEEVSLCIDEEGHTSVNGGVPTKVIILLEGPHDSFLTMFRDEHRVSGVPKSIKVHVEGIGSSYSVMAQQMNQSAVNQILRYLFE